jgi:plastocyanin
MRRHVSLTLTLLLLVATGATAGVASAGASTPGPLVIPRTAVKMRAGSDCNPVQSFCFRPRNKTVVSPTRVVFKNLTTAPHTVTRCTPAACSGVSGGTGTDTGFGSGTIASGTSYKFVFRGTGTYTYYCSIHGYALMHGTITVNP